MRPWFIAVILLILGGVVVFLLLPAMPAGPAKSEISKALSNCRQLQLAVQEYSMTHDRSSATLSALVEAKLIDQPLLNRLTRDEGMYFVSFRSNMSPEDILIEVFLPKAYITMTVGGDGRVNPNPLVDHTGR